jgi:hypothetical protein
VNPNTRKSKKEAYYIKSFHDSRIARYEIFEQMSSLIEHIIQTIQKVKSKTPSIARVMVNIRNIQKSKLENAADDLELRTIIREQITFDGLVHQFSLLIETLRSQNYIRRKGDIGMKSLYSFLTRMKGINNGVINAYSDWGNYLTERNKINIDSRFVRHEPRRSEYVIRIQKKLLQ